MLADDARRYGVLGWPVAHSRSPAMHAAAYRDLGLEGWRYQRLPVPPDRFDETVRALGPAGLSGANVTIPHKEAALAVADAASATARAIGAANTLTFGDDGSITADNTDAPGLIDALPVAPRGARAVVLGAGGSARAVVWALLDAGAADVAVWNRTPERAVELADALGARAVTAVEPGDLLVNCTSVELQDTDPFAAWPLEVGDIARYPTVVDLAYSDGETALVAAARDADCAVVDGLEILVRQGALSLKIWTGLDASLDVMRTAAA